MFGQLGCQRCLPGCAIQERQAQRVQPESAGKGVDADEPAVAVARVAHDRMPQPLQMPTDLMLASGLGGDLQQRAVRQRLERAVARHSLQRTAASQGDVACPFRVGAQAETCVVASELVEHLAAEGVDGLALSLEGRIMEIDGVRYVVLTAYEPSTP